MPNSGIFLDSKKMTEEIITSKNNDTVKYLISLQEKSNRERYGCFIMEGKRAVFEAVEAGVVEQIVVSQAYLRDKDFHIIKGKSLPITVLSEAMFARVSETKTPQGILALCKIKKYNLQKVLDEEKSILLLSDVRDPGNMGTVIRTAAAAGFGGIIASDGCVDVYNSKVVRSTVGCLFKVKIIQCKGCFTNVADEVKHKGFKLYAAHPRGGKSLFDVGFNDKTAIVLGNEANGIPNTLLKQCDVLVTIAMATGVESLNASVAAALMMYEVKRKNKI